MQGRTSFVVLAVLPTCTGFSSTQNIPPGIPLKALITGTSSRFGQSSYCRQATVLSETEPDHEQQIRDHKSVKVDGSRAYTVYRPQGWDRDIYRPPDEIHFEWQELLCCFAFMQSKDINAATLALETKQLMIEYAEAIMSKGSPVNTLQGLQNALLGRWRLAFTTEDKYKVLPPGTSVWFEIFPNGKLKNCIKFKDKYWNGIDSTAHYQLSQQGRLMFEFDGNQVNINKPFALGSQWRIPLPPKMGNLGNAFIDVSYLDGTMWIEKLRDPATGNVYYNMFQYCGDC